MEGRHSIRLSDLFAKKGKDGGASCTENLNQGQARIKEDEKNQ